MAELIARYKPGVEVPAFAVTQVNAGHFVKIVATKTSQGDYSVGHCAAGNRAFGVAQMDSGAPTLDANDASRRINCVRRGAIARVVPGAAITAGQDVQSDGTGQAIPYTAGAGVVALGQAVHDAADADAFVEVDLY